MSIFENGDCVYVVVEFVNNKSTNNCKIGICENVGNVELRLRGLQVGNPRRLVFSRIYRIENAYKIERYIHKKYDKQRQMGEWFILSKQILKSIDSLILRKKGKIIFTEVTVFP